MTVRMELCKIIRCTDKMRKKWQDQRNTMLWQILSLTFEYFFLILKKKISQPFCSMFAANQKKHSSENELISVKSNCCSSWNKSQSNIFAKRNLIFFAYLNQILFFSFYYHVQLFTHSKIKQEKCVHCSTAIHIFWAHWRPTISSFSELGFVNVIWFCMRIFPLYTFLLLYEWLQWSAC